MLAEDMCGDYEESNKEEVEHKLSKSGKRTWVCEMQWWTGTTRRKKTCLANNKTIKLLMCSLPESILLQMSFWRPQSPGKINLLLLVNNIDWKRYKIVFNLFYL